MATAIIFAVSVLTYIGKNNEPKVVSSETTAEQTTEHKMTEEEASAYIASVQQSRAEADAKTTAKNASIAAKDAEEKSAAAESRTAIEKERPTGVTEYETEASTVIDPVSTEPVTVPEGAVAVVATEAIVQSAEATTELIETTDELVAAGLWPHNSSTNNLKFWSNPAKYYALEGVCDNWCNNGYGDENADCSSTMNSIAGSKDHSRAITFSGRTIDSWSFRMELLTEQEDAPYAFSYFRSFYNSSSNITTVWYAYATATE